MFLCQKLHMNQSGLKMKMCRNSSAKVCQENCARDLVLSGMVGNLAMNCRINVGSLKKWNPKNRRIILILSIKRMEGSDWSCPRYDLARHKFKLLGQIDLIDEGRLFSFSLLFLALCLRSQKQVS